VINHVGHYCGRFDPGFWGEPLNALTSVTFVIAAVLAFRVWRRGDERDWPSLFLILCAATIGLGSFAFHTQPTPSTLLIDLIPTQIFVLAYFGLAVRRFFGASWGVMITTLAGFLLITALSNMVLHPGLLGGGVRYLPALVALALCGGWLAWRGIDKRAQQTGRRLLAATGTLVVALFFRTIDLPLCAAFPYGVHWVWHIFTGTTVGILLFTAIKHGRS
jgi:chromate transport protein ChrA